MMFIGGSDGKASIRACYRGYQPGRMPYAGGLTAWKEETRSFTGIWHFLRHLLPF